MCDHCAYESRGSSSLTGDCCVLSSSFIGFSPSSSAFLVRPVPSAPVVISMATTTGITLLHSRHLPLQVRTADPPAIAAVTAAQAVRSAASPRTRDARAVATQSLAPWGKRRSGRERAIATPRDARQRARAAAAATNATVCGRLVVGVAMRGDGREVGGGRREAGGGRRDGGWWGDPCSISC